eukprot:5171415-Alexandrium_andersonii.AAC.1
MKVTASYCDTLSRSIAEARRAALLPIDWRHKRLVVAGGATVALAWAQVCKPMRCADRLAYDAAVRVGICNRRRVGGIPCSLTWWWGGTMPACFTNAYAGLTPCCTKRSAALGRPLLLRGW